ncbi:CWF19-like protein 2 [Lineus longissimus]|uniref:CWF19-like protein 2 n=1 Tax=Lineus longissimus TaxID=88925 RepID=UPI002B4E219D
MSVPIAFRSSLEYEAERQEKRDARSRYLEKAKKEYDKNEKKKELARQKGDDTWMLPSVSSRVDKESSKHKKKKKDKKKKHKKHKKSKHKDGESSDSDSDEPTWVEKGHSEDPMDTDASLPSTKVVKGPAMMPQDWKLQRDDWMAAPIDLVPCVTRDELRDRIKKDKKEKEEEVNLFDQPGQHARELNPFWKDGGTGVPDESPSAKASAPVLGDGGVGWLKKAYQRCVEQAEEEKRSLEDIAAERYGSLEKLESMIMKAERNLQRKREEEQLTRMEERKKRNDRHGDRVRRSRSRDIDVSRRRKSRSNSQDRDSSKCQNRSYSRERGSSKRRRSRSSSKERYYSRRRRSRSCSKDREMSRRSRSDSAEQLSRRQRSRSQERSQQRRSRSRSKERESSSSKYRFMNPNDNQSSRRQFMKPDDSEKSSKRTFMKPGDSDSGSMRSKYRKPDSGNDNIPAWKKRDFIKADDRGEDKSVSRHSDRKDLPSAKKESQKAPSPKRRDASDSEDSSSSEPSESSEEEVPPQVPILSEQEMNTLGAKIVKAELMGNEDLAAKLKTQLELARSAKEANASRVAASGGKKTKQKDVAPEDVMLTTITRSGIEMPLPARKTPQEPSGGRRKKQKVTTHGTSGERERYFADDDKYDLKTMFQREKLGTAEDQDRMFARLAGKAMEKTDDDYQVDDVFVNRANKKLSDSKEENRQRSDAIAQHSKMASALGRCDLCLEKCPKHLIIAIGIKCYLCLPNYLSLTEGHCQIVPIQHVSAGTAADEDVWNEIQVFRKGLTKLFEDKDMDCAFMETVMGLKWQPHMIMECVPMPRETGEMAPIYFKKAIQESGTEWDQNKKLVDIRQKDIRRSVPKGFPYFSVDFGLQGGFAHVIENEKIFPKYFGKEIIGGMLDLEPRLWRKPMKENFEDQRTKVLQFSKWWKPFDWTLQLHKQDDD